MSKSLFVKKVSNEELSLDDAILKATFGEAMSHVIAESPWAASYPYCPEVAFQIVHSPDFIALHYQVSEEFVKAQAIRANESVWEDSCVEFFLSLDNKQTYYNFEFNVLGTGLIGYGSAVKADRNRLSAEQIETVDTLTQVIKRNGAKKWSIFLLIPKKILHMEDFSGKTMHGNFYKCGDALPNPHFVAWNTIDHPTPNFHLPQFFGALNFE